MATFHLLSRNGIPVTLHQNFKAVQRIARCSAATSVEANDSLLNKIKKIVFGKATTSKEQPDTVYYELEKPSCPLIYSMSSPEIKQKFDSIVNELGYHNKDIADDLVKYKVLCRCYEEFGLLLPSYNLNHITQLQEIEYFYCNAKRPATEKTFQNLDMDDIPPNLIIGGKVPRKLK